MTGWRKKQIDDAMAGDGGYEIGTQEGYDAFVKVRNQSLVKMRIKELVEQALKHPDTDDDGLTVFDNDELEKFAELIVEECISVCRKTRNDLEQHGKQFDIDQMQRQIGVNHCTANIKQHFGVEE